MKLNVKRMKKYAVNSVPDRFEMLIDNHDRNPQPKVDAAISSFRRQMQQKHGNDGGVDVYIQPDIMTNQQKLICEYRPTRR